MIVLIGPPGAGKTSAGRELARTLGAEFTDTDEVVAATAGKPVADIFLEDGEDAFRELEREAAVGALASHDGVVAMGSGAGGTGGVVALGSGAVLDETVRAVLQGQPARTVVYLQAGFATVARAAGLDRPRVVLPGNPRGRLRAMLEERGPLYESLATITVQADDLPPEVLAAEIADRIAGPAGAGA